jgi:Na+/H+ antiporter NhaD/arsenite permease-like protein
MTKKRMIRGASAISLAGLLLADLFWSAPVLASGAQPAINGAQLGAVWVAPFVCLLLSIAILPVSLPHFWHDHYGKVSLFWSLAFLAPYSVLYGLPAAFMEFQHAITQEYVPFVILLFALFTISGGVRITGTLKATPLMNTTFLCLGTFLASLMGTTGASMLLIRPLLRANEHRKYRIHTVVFFIFLVANIGGSLTPLGDPPLFLGFLKGVSFFWTTKHLFWQMLFASTTLLIIYYFLDRRQYSKEAAPPPADSGAVIEERIDIEGRVNLVLLLGVVGAVLMSGFWKPGTDFQFLHIQISLQDLTRDIIMLCLAGLSLLLTSGKTRELNGFSWEPIVEVAKLFFGIFVSMIPAIAILKAGQNGALRDVIALVTRDGVPVNSMYFWLTGTLSSFLDNAPTYLVFFNTAGGDAATLMAEAPKTLAAISCGAVFMGANSYIGNAPNFMVRSIAESKGVQMPSFIGYMAWSLCFLIPLFIVTTLLFFVA